MFSRSQPPASNPSGTLLDGRYRLGDSLGEGGAGIIYQAVDEQLGRTVAIKLLTGMMTPEKLGRFASEARSVARLNHPNIVTLFDFAQAGGQPYLVLEYIPGQDLWAYDNSYSPELMPFEVSLPIINGILAALQYSHQQSVIHRDLKPENVMITPELQVKVMDFGLARIQGQSRLTQEGLVAGTASYLAPELALGEAGDHRADLYALGVILYELCTGRRPFSGDDPLAVISQHIHAPVVPPQRYNAAIPDDLQEIIVKLLAKQPEDRYEWADEVQKALAPIITRIERDDAQQITDTYAINDILAIEQSAQHQTLLDRISRGKIVGREEELNILKQRWDLARIGELAEGPLVLLAGEAGIGKTRLLREFEVYANLRDGSVLLGTAREQDVGTPYAIFANALRQYVREHPAAVLQRQTPGFTAGEVVKLAPELADKLGYIAPNPPLEPEAERARLLEQVSNFFLNMAAEQPVLLLLDDLHFADPGSINLLETLIRRAQGTNLFVTGAYQDVALSYSNPVNRLIATLNTANLGTNLALRRLTQEGVEQMLIALLEDSVSPNFVSSIYQATEGNPLFIEEVVKSLAVDGQILLREGRWEQRDTDHLNVPGSIKSVLGGRLEQIKKSSRELLQLGAVIGRNFSLDILSLAGPLAEEEIEWAVEEALRFQLIEVHKIIDDVAADTAKPKVNVEYQFQHALIRETLYEELRPLRRRQLHRRIASALSELRTAGRADFGPATLARHYINAAQEEAAVPFLREAGQAALRVYANPDAVENFSQAQEILEDIALDLRGKALKANLAEQFDLIEQQRGVLNVMGESERELIALEQLQELASTLKDQQRQVSTRARLAAYYWRIGQLNQAEETARQALKMARKNDDQLGQLASLEQIARIFWTRRDKESMTFAKEALAIAQALGDRPREGRVTELIASIYTDTTPDVVQADAHFKQALTICQETGNRYEEAWTLWGMGRLSLLVDDYTGALDRYQQARKISENIGATLQTGWDLYHMGDAWYNLGDQNRALACYEEARTIFNSAHHVRGRINALISVGLVYMAQSKMDEAEHILEQARKQAEERSDLILMLRCYQALSALYRTSEERAQLIEAVRLSNRIIKLAEDGGHFEHELLGYHLRGAGFFDLNDMQQALASSVIAVERLEQISHLHSPQISAAEIYYLHSRIFRELEQGREANVYLQKAEAETMRKANFIVEDNLYANFLHGVPLNQRILAAARRFGI